MSDNPPKNEKKGGSRGFYTILALVVLVSLFISVVLNLVLMVTVVAVAGNQQGDLHPNFRTKVLEGEGEDKVLVIPVSGIIMSSSSSEWSDQMATPTQIGEKLKHAAKNKSIKVVILKINSPGGTITATDKIYQSILDYKQETGNKVVAYMDSVAASGGYYLAMACDKVFAHPTTITGSIGVIMSFYQIQDLLENKLGIKQVVLKTGDHKDIGSMTRPLSESEEKILNDILEEMYLRFLDKVKTGRPALAKLSDEELRKLADGRIYTGKQAEANGLIDGTGLFQKAVDEAMTLAGAKKQETQLIEYQNKRSFWQEMMQASTQNPNSEVKNLITDMTSPRFYYMWKP